MAGEVFWEYPKLGEVGEEGRDNDPVRETFERTGASMMGKRMSDLGEQAWREEAPVRAEPTQSGSASASRRDRRVT
jgi:hypothetical protein